MQQKLKYTVLLLLSLVFWGCEEEVQLDLVDSDPQLVIEGWVTDAAGPYEFRLSRSVAYLGSETQPSVSGAVIVLSDDMGNSETLVEAQPGFYYTNQFQGQQNHNYTVKVTVDGVTHTAENYLPRVNPMDSLWFTYEPDFLFGAGYYVNLLAPEPLGVGDFYQFRIWRNDSLFSAPADLLVTDDRFVDGQVSPLLFPYPHEEGDTVMVEIRGISNFTYDYYITVFQQAQSGGGPFGSPPENLLTNFDNDALGFFGCAASTRDTIVIIP